VTLFTIVLLLLWSINPAHGERKLLPIPVAARRLGIGRTLMYELLGAGVIPTVRIGSKRRLVPVEALDAYADNLEREHNINS
jgi:excisionase family DNA binding protein